MDLWQKTKRDWFLLLLLLYCYSYDRTTCQPSIGLDILSSFLPYLFHVFQGILTNRFISNIYSFFFFFSHYGFAFLLLIWLSPFPFLLFFVNDISMSHYYWEFSWKKKSEKKQNKRTITFTKHFPQCVLSPITDETINIHSCVF